MNDIAACHGDGLLVSSRSSAKVNTPASSEDGAGSVPAPLPGGSRAAGPQRNQPYVPPCRRNAGPASAASAAPPLPAPRGGPSNPALSSAAPPYYRNTAPGERPRRTESGRPSYYRHEEDSSAFWGTAPSQQSGPAPARQRPEPQEYVPGPQMPRGGGGGGWSSHSRDRLQEAIGPDGLMPRDETLEGQLFTTHANTGINFAKYLEIPVEAFGQSVPPPFDHFSALDLHPVLRNSIELLGYESPTPVQRYSLPIIFAGRDLMACAQTGSGKTAAFLFPIIGRILNELDSLPPSSNPRKVCPLALVLAPTRELASQIFDEACKFTYRSVLRPVVVYGGTNFTAQLQDLVQGCHILVATPGRLVDMFQRGKVSLSAVRYLCLDEADRMLDMGFEYQIRRIVQQSDMPGSESRQTLMFSATFPREIQRLAGDFLNGYIFLKVGRVGSTTDFIKQNILHVEDADKVPALFSAIESIAGLTLIFVETKRQADTLEDILYTQGYPAASIHGDRTQSQREAALESFRRGHTPILVATDVAARGLDISNVAHVINFDMPRDIDDYVHRIGRTGRAGNPGVATAFFSSKNRNLTRELINLLDEAKQHVPEWISTMSSDVRGGGSSFGGGSGGGGYRSGGGGSGGPRMSRGGGGPPAYAGARGGGGGYGRHF